MKGYRLSLLFSVPCLILSLMMAKHVTPQDMDGYCRNVTQDPFSKCVRQSTCWFFSEPKALMKGYERKHYCAAPKVRDDINDKLCCCPRKPTPKIPQTVIDIVSRKCDEYAKFAFNSHLALNGRKLQETICVENSNLVAYGKPAYKENFPHMVRIGTPLAHNSNDIGWFCAGALISERFVLTAAHCVENMTSKNELRVGLITMYDEQYKKPKIFGIAESIIHPNYDIGMKYQNDVALLQLNISIEIDIHVRPICLSVSSDSLDTLKNFTIAGWGDTDWDTSTRSASDLRKLGTGGLLEGSMCLSYGNTDCEKKSTNFNITFNSYSMICAVSCLKANNSHTCPVDVSGLAQISSGRCVWTQVGITTFGNTLCGHNSIPGVFSKISHYIEWIQKNVWPEGL